MTSERRLLMGFADVKALAFECLSCKARLTLTPKQVRVERLMQCPTCGQDWLDTSQGPTGPGFAAPMTRFVNLFAKVVAGNQSDKPDPAIEVGFRVLMEYEEPK